MTKLTKRTAFRQSQVSVRDCGEQREILVALEPACIVLRLKGTRTEYRAPLASVLQRLMFDVADAKRIRRRPVKRGMIGGLR